MIVQQFESTKNLFEALCLILTFTGSFGIFTICFFVGEMILEIFGIYHREINSNTSCPWTTGIISRGKVDDHFYFDFGFICFIHFQESGSF